MGKKDGGYIVVETIGAFIPFVFLILSILSLVNIVTLQARVHYAITQAANTLSMYSYALEVTGIADRMVKMDENAGKVDGEIMATKEEVNALLTGIDSLSAGDVKTHGEALVGRIYGQGESLAEDPQKFLSELMDYSLNTGKNKAFEPFIRPLVGRYLGNGDMNGDTYLNSVNVIDGLKGLDFYEVNLTNATNGGTNSSFINAKGDIKIAVSYEIEYKFGALPLPFEPKLRVTQMVQTKAWLGGSGEGYW